MIGMIKKFSLEFILTANDTSSEAIKGSLTELGENLEVSSIVGNASCQNDFKVRIETLDPTIIFDTCSQFGRIRAIKID